MDGSTGQKGIKSTFKLRRYFFRRVSLRLNETRQRDNNSILKFYFICILFLCLMWISFALLCLYKDTPPTDRQHFFIAILFYLYFLSMLDVDFVCIVFKNTLLVFHYELTTKE